MGKYKDEKGTTRIGDILRGMGDVGKPILAAAGKLTGQPWLNAIADGIKSSSDIKGEQKRALFEMLKLDVADRKDSRNMNVEIQKSKNASWLSKNIVPMLAIVLTLMVALAIVALFYVSIPEANKATVYMVMGSLMTAWIASITFYFGSSQGSKDKTNVLSGK